MKQFKQGPAATQARVPAHTYLGRINVPELGCIEVQIAVCPHLNAVEVALIDWNEGSVLDVSFLSPDGPQASEKVRRSEEVTW